MCTYNFILALYITCNGFTYKWIFNKSTLKFLGEKIKLINYNGIVLNTRECVNIF